ncbi:MAG: protein-L-isoaspartate(D-aspartate) O-methyltransferase [Candidatus Marinimicrobia bacterium]|jgi:protein-L-isoaspartate(D-aspartate) O-methyltransferase|nr:protein-L-isoaspartate(D-aspartate) O-methyltransferase [Candidatus Neomarinimicrobiota bacterium]MBT3680822.1 protein-L-isoaspartate(D-aspartate) O-methyltransferase [Candidatus Neomarinimicrobiota bacterium]MBT3950729.1 protein-L-isoaspartate(D-aspartate) O-methyltransferase [Candidatus Neomarinimicrobiota bacterium]MBT4252307.1 protein-L-isoaspartate(D-aspartate) O-methyltransferase [Candidatus Neomarinimicrobiota bacterium]MBT5236045.1 protein-L-isoaspartate(D-aspartate) O-methyltransfer
MGITENEDTQDLRQEMVSNQLMRRGIVDPAILDAFKEIPRHLFVPHINPGDAYVDQPLPIKSGQTISQPYVVALMLGYLGLHQNYRVLEIGSGSGYATAIMSKLCQHVTAMEVYGELLEDSRTVINQMELLNIDLMHGSAWEHLKEGIVYDRIILWASPPRIPEHIFESLKEGGILVAPEGKADQYVWICTKKDGHILRKRKDPVRFVPLVHGSVHEIDRNMQGKRGN